MNSLDNSKLSLLAQALAEERKRRARRKIDRLFPDEGPLRRELYAEHLKFFRATAEYREVMMLAGNRVGKSVAGGYAVTCWLTGQYPSWWEGRRFDCPVEVWAASDSAQTTRDILQYELLGKPGEEGTGLIPGDAIKHTVAKPGTPNAIESVWVRSKFAPERYSHLQFKSFDQGREKWQGTAKHVCWLDESCPMDVYGEALMRTLTLNGLVLTTFTPVEGLTPLVASFLEGEAAAERL